MGLLKWGIIIPGMIILILVIGIIHKGLNDEVNHVMKFPVPPDFLNMIQLANRLIFYFYMIILLAITYIIIN